MTLRAPAKLNLFLKITGRRVENGVRYHEILSRFVLVESLFDELEFKLGGSTFSIIGDCGCEMRKNTIYKAYLEILPYCSEAVKSALSTLTVRVKKLIPTGAGLGGGSSDAAAFLRFCNEHFKLLLSKQQLMEIGAKVGSDVPFFVSGERCANVSGRGEIIEGFSDPSLLDFDFEFITPPVHCSTPAVFAEFAEHFEIAAIEKNFWRNLTLAEIVRQSADQNNDLLKAVLRLTPELKVWVGKDAFLSGSGSAFWRVKAQGEA